MKQENARAIVDKTQRDYDTISKYFSDTRRFQWHAVQFLVEQIVQPGQNVLDIGCGNGRVADLITEQRAGYIGVDLSPKLIEIARTLRPSCEFHVANMTQLPFGPNSFNHIVSIASFHHLPGESKRLQALEEMKRVLVPDGTIIMTNWNLHQWRFWKMRMGFNIKRWFKRHDMEKNDTLVPWRTSDGNTLAERYYHGFTKKEIKKLAQQAGLHVDQQYYEKHGMHVPRRKGQNLITILKKT